MPSPILLKIRLFSDRKRTMSSRRPYLLFVSASSFSNATRSFRAFAPLAPVLELAALRIGKRRSCNLPYLISRIALSWVLESSSIALLSAGRPHRVNQTWPGSSQTSSYVPSYSRKVFSRDESERSMYSTTGNPSISLEPLVSLSARPCSISFTMICSRELICSWCDIDGISLSDRACKMAFFY